MSSRSTLVLCTALSLISAFRVIVERKCHDNTRFTHITSRGAEGGLGARLPRKFFSKLELIMQDCGKTSLLSLVRWKERHTTFFIPKARLGKTNPVDGW